MANRSQMIGDRKFTQSWRSNALEIVRSPPVRSATLRAVRHRSSRVQRAGVTPMLRMLTCGLGVVLAAGHLHPQAVQPVPEAPSRQAAQTRTGPTAAGPSAADSQRALLDTYCITCHNERLRTGGLRLDRVDVEHVGEAAEVWEKVVRKLRAGQMPRPAGRGPRRPPTTASPSGSRRSSIGRPPPGRIPGGRSSAASTGSSTPTRSGTCWRWKSTAGRCCPPTSPATASTMLETCCRSPPGSWSGT